MRAHMRTGCLHFYIDRLRSVRTVRTVRSVRSLHSVHSVRMCVVCVVCTDLYANGMCSVQIHVQL